MERHAQTKAELIELLGEVKTDWKDADAKKFIDFLGVLPEGGALDRAAIIEILTDDFDDGILFFRLLFEQSKDEFTLTLKKLFINEELGAGKTAFKDDPAKYSDKLISLGLPEMYASTINKNFTWKDIVLERLKAGRGSAIKGQTRGRNLENFVEAYVKEVFGTSYEAKVSFTGRDPNKKAKADFCIPSRTQPKVIIEVKAYGATGSKQSDVIGDIEKIIKEKRSDMFFLLVTDGVTWVSRLKDFERLVAFQNEGDIYRIYTQKMEKELATDLLQFKKELNIS